MYALCNGVALTLKEGPVEEEISRLQLGEEAFELCPRGLGVLKRLYELNGDVKDSHAAFALVEETTARLFAEKLGRSHAYRTRAQSGDFHERVGYILGKLKSTRQRLSAENNKPINDRSAERAGALMKELSLWDDKLHELMNTKDDPTGRALQFLFPRPSSLAEARMAMAENEVAVLFVPGFAAS